MSYEIKSCTHTLLGPILSQKVGLYSKFGLDVKTDNTSGTWTAQSVKHLPSVQVMILGSWDQAPCLAPCSAGESASPPLSATLLLVRFHSNRKKKTTFRHALELPLCHRKPHYVSNRHFQSFLRDQGKETDLEFYGIWKMGLG